MPLDDAWEFMMDTYDSIHYGTLPSDQILDYWLAKLQSDNITDCWTAVEYFSTLRELPVPPSVLIDVIEQHFDALLKLYGALIAHEEKRSVTSDDAWKAVYRPIVGDIHREISFLAETLELLIPVADEPAIERMLGLYEQEVSSPNSIFNLSKEKSRYDWEAPRPLIPRIVQLALNHPGPKRRERFLRLVSCRPLPKLLDRSMLVAELGRTDGEDIDRLLMDMLCDPATFGINHSSELHRFLWKTMARRGQPEFREYLEQFVADPNESDLAKFKDYNPEHFRYVVRGAQDLFNKYYATPAEKENARRQRLEDLVEQYRDGDSSVMASIAELIQADDEEFRPFFCEQTDALEADVAITIAAKLPDPCFIPVLRKTLEKRVTSDLLAVMSACGAQEEAIQMGVAKLEKAADGWIIRFLGTTGEVSVLPIIEEFTREQVIELYRDETWRSYTASHLQQSAVLALGRLGQKSAVGRLRELYESEHTDIMARIAAALSLYYLGDDTGLELLEHFVNNTERNIPEVEMRWGVDLSTGRAFQAPIATYLRSPRADVLLLERLRDGLGSNDGRWILSSTFFKDYERQILPIIVDHLSSTDRRTRKYANEILTGVTSQDFGFQPEKFVGQQTEAIERWRNYVDDYLAQTAQPKE
jgi:HEAT repeat protein